MGLLAGELRQRGADEQQEGDKRGDRVAGQAEDERSLAGAEPERLARPQGHAGEVTGDTEASERISDVVVLADRHAARDHDDVGCEGPLDRSADQRGLVAGVRDRRHAGAGPRHERGDHQR